MSEELEDASRLNTALASVRARGLTWAVEFYNLPKEEKILRLAELIYVSVALDPFGYPNGRPDFSELPYVDHDYKVGDDKLRYIQAAASVYNRLNWKPNSD